MHHITGEILNKAVNLDTLYFAWACMALVLVVAFVLSAGVSADTEKYGSRQHFVETIFNFIRGIARDQIGKRADSYVFFIGSIFLFITSHKHIFVSIIKRASCVTTTTAPLYLLIASARA